jgi:cytochrome c
MRVALTVAVSLSAILAACGKSDSPASTAAPEAPVPAVTDEAAQAMLTSLPAPYNGADWANGKKQWARCHSCHTLGQGQADMIGPNLYGVFNRPMASRPGYNYSDALKNSGEHGWDGAHMDHWIQDPRAAHPGTKMTFAGLKDADDRRDVIAYLMTETGYKSH